MRHLIRAAAVAGLLTMAISVQAEGFPPIPGWEPETEVLRFDSENLWQHINGAADQFMAFGFRELQTCELASGDLLVALEIYDMGSPINAFGIYKAQQSGPGKPLPLEVESLLYLPYQGLMIKGRFYVKLEIYEGELDETVAGAVFGAIAGSIPGRSGPPPEFAMLPARERIPGSEGWTRRSFLGLAALNNCLHASYGDGEPWLQFTILPQGDQTPREIWDALGGKWRGVDGEQGMVTREIPYKGSVGLVLTSDGIFGIADMASEQLPDMLRQIRRERENSAE